VSRGAEVILTASLGVGAATLGFIIAFGATQIAGARFIAAVSHLPFSTLTVM
jgi:hypothetical protein